MGAGWNATVFRIAFDANETATFELPQPNRIHTMAVVSSGAGNLGGARVIWRASHDGVNYAPVKTIAAEGVQAMLEGVYFSFQIEVENYSAIPLTVTVASGLPGMQIREIDDTVPVTTVTPS